LVIKITKLKVGKYVQDATEFIITTHVHFENDRYNKLIPTNDNNLSIPIDDSDHVSDYHKGDTIQSRLTNVVSNLNELSSFF